MLENDDFEKSLRDDAYIADDGFTQSVMAQLPAAPTRASKRKRVLTAAFALAGAIFVYQAVALAMALIKSGALSTTSPARWESLVMNPVVLLGGAAMVAAFGFGAMRLLAYLDENVG